MIGLYGPIFFHSGTPVTTFDNMKKTVTARWGSHDVWMDKPLLEYSGPQLIEISFTMELITPFTADPLGTVFLLEETMDLAIPYPLVIGMKPMGRGMSLFVMTSLSSQPKYFYRSGSWLGCSVEVQLKEYPNISLSNLIQALGGVFGGQTPGAGTTGPFGTDAASTGAAVNQGPELVGSPGDAGAGPVNAGPELVGQDTSAGTVPSSMITPESDASFANSYSTIPQIAQNYTGPTYGVDAITGQPIPDPTGQASSGTMAGQGPGTHLAPQSARAIAQSFWRNSSVMKNYLTHVKN